MTGPDRVAVKASIRHTSPEAVLVDFGPGNALPTRWVPRAVIAGGAELVEDPAVRDLSIAGWWARRAGLVAAPAATQGRLDLGPPSGAAVRGAGKG